MAQVETMPLAPTSFGKKSPWNAYTLFLGISLAALLMAVIFLYLEIRQFGGLFSYNGP